MQNLAVHWHEGLFLRPHHLQAWDRHWHETTTASERWGSPYRYGVASIEINRDALAAGFFQLDNIRAKTSEGTLIELAPGESTERRDLRQTLTGEQSKASTIPFDGRASLDVYLGIPRLQLGGRNVSAGDDPDTTGNNEGTRFRPLQVHVPDEADAASVEPIVVRRMNAKLLLSSDDLAGFEVLKIARVHRGTVGGEIAELDQRYIPPLLDCTAWPALNQGVLLSLHDRMLLKIELLAQLVATHGNQLDATQPGDLQRILMLQTLNQNAAALDALKQTGGVHPWHAYLELGRIAGALDVFSDKRSARPLPPYDHNDLGPLFHSLRTRIEASIASVAQNAYQQRFFVGSGMGMQVSLDPQWLMSGWRCVLGVRRGKLSPTALEQALSPGSLDWKIGSARQVEMLYSNRMSGVNLEPLREVPRNLPSQGDWSFFDLGGGGPAWNDVLETGTLAMRLREDLIENRSELNGNQTLRVRVSDQRLQLQFAIFAVNDSDES